MDAYENGWSVKARDLGGDRGGRPIARGVSFTLEPGGALQLFGANGAGKSSLLQVFGGLLPPADGELSWRPGVDTQWDNAVPRHQLLFLTDTPSIKVQLTVRENATFWARAYGIADAQRPRAIDAALNRVGLEALADMRAERLSAGQRRRLDLVRAFIARRPIWLMDEPTAALDAESANAIGLAITDHLKANGIAIIATHATLNAPSTRLVIG